VTAYGVPVKHWNDVIGTAVIHDDGVIDITFNVEEGPHFGRLVSELISRGVVTGLTLSPMMIPEAPVFPGHEKPYGSNAKPTTY
jgi:hypothetical protein